MKQIWNRIYEDIKQYWKFAILVLVYILVMRIIFHGEICPLRIIIGIPCPGCGVTRACLYLITFQWKKAVEMNAVVFMLAAFAIWFFAYRYILGKCAPQWKKVIMIIIIIMIIYYIYRMYFIFPSEPPMNWNEEAFLLRIKSFVENK